MIDQDTLDKLATGEYSISPRSGRIRKRIKSHRKKNGSFFTKKNMKKYGIYAMWVILVICFIISLVVVLPELKIGPDTNKPNYQYRGR